MDIEPTKQLCAAIDELREQQRTVNIFFRADDVDEDELALRKLMKEFFGKEIPLNLEIIPARLSHAGYLWLRHCYARAPQLFEYHQHGWQHLNHEAVGRKCEFGASRSYAEQLADIRRGRELLELALEDAFFPVFTPPWNRCTTDTYRALDELGFHAFSGLRGAQPVAGYRFRELSVTLDLHTWRDGPKLKDRCEFVRELREQFRAGGTIGIMLHHKVMDREAWLWLDLLLFAMQRQPFFKFHTFESLLKAT